MWGRPGEPISTNTTAKRRDAEYEENQPNRVTLYKKLNVPNLKSRSKEYQRLVKAVGKASMKEELNGYERLSVINAVSK